MALNTKLHTPEAKLSYYVFRFIKLKRERNHVWEIFISYKKRSMVRRKFQCSLFCPEKCITDLVFQRTQSFHRWKRVRFVFWAWLQLYASLNHLAHTSMDELFWLLIRDLIERTNVPHKARPQRSPGIFYNVLDNCMLCNWLL